MARRDEIPVSLFPFMSVLACTIGALTLLLASLSLSAVAPREKSQAEGASRARVGSGSSEVPSRPSSSSPRLERESIESLEALWAAVDRALTARGQAAGVSLGALESQVASLRQRRQLESDLERLTTAVRDLERERDSVEVSIEVLESRRQTLPILIDPTGLSRHLEPWFVECDGRGATAYRASDGYAHFVPGDELGATGDYGRYLRRLRAIPGSLLVLLIRPDGLRTAASAARIADAAGVRVARLPLPGHGALDWELIRRAEQGSTR